MFFTLDGSLREKLPAPVFNGPGYFFSYFLYLLNQFLDVALIQKGFYFFIMSFLLIGSYLAAPFKNNFAKLFFAGFLTFNPFVYARFLSGHTMVILGYAIFIHLFLAIFRKESASKYGLIAIILFLLMLTSIHFLFIGSMFIGGYLLIKFLFLRDVTIKNIWPIIVACVLVTITYIFTAIQPFPGLNDFLEFSSQDLFAFISLPDNKFGLIPNIISLYGFWNEGEHQFILLKQIIIFWPVVTLILVGAALMGFIKYWKKNQQQDEKIAAFFTLGFAFFSLILAVGVQSELLQSAVIFIYDKTKIFNILREPHKIIGVVAVFMAFFSSYYFEEAGFKAKKITVLFLLLAYVYYPGFVFGFNKEIKMSFYPNDWYKARTFLNNDSGDFRLLVFPWHMYMPFRFANYKNIYNVAAYFFDQQKTISARNYEVKALYTHDNSLEQMHVEGLLNMTLVGKNLFGERAKMTTGWGEALSPIDVKYIMLLKESSWRTYKFLDKQKDLAKIYGNESLTIYKNLMFGKK